MAPASAHARGMNCSTGFGLGRARTSLADGPHEAGSSRAIAVHTTVVFLPRAQTLDIVTVAGLGFPRDLSHPGWGLLHTVQFHLSDPRWMPVGPCTFNKHVPKVGHCPLW